MPRGMSNCRHCGKSVPSIYRPYHEQVACLVMRRKRGDPDVVHRKLLPRVMPTREIKDLAQRRLLEFGVVT